MPSFDAVVLSAGFSSRMDGFKPLYEINGNSVLAGVVEAFKKSGAREVVVVSGHNAELVRAEAEKHGARVVHNPDFADGMFTSVMAGAKALDRKADAFFILPVDIPLVRTSTMILLWDSYVQDPATMIHPVFEGERGHPPLIRMPVAEKILSWSGDGGLCGLLEKEEQDFGGVRELPVADRGTLLDMDTEDDYARLRGLRRDIPDDGEVEAIFNIVGTPDQTRIHGRAVSRVAVAMAEALNRAKGYSLDLELIKRASQLHDVAKGHKYHEKRGAEMVLELGFPALYKAISSHRDMAACEEMDIDESCLVFVADKVVKGDNLVTVRDRYGFVLQYHGHVPEVRKAIEGRRQNGLVMFDLVQKAVGEDLMDLAARALEGV